MPSEPKSNSCGTELVLVDTDAFIMEIDCKRDARAQVYTERSI